jgi:hypothetical protein
VGGLFVPARGATWPAADKTHALYKQDAMHYLRHLAQDPVGAGEVAEHQHPPQ